MRTSIRALIFSAIGALALVGTPKSALAQARPAPVAGIGSGQLFVGANYQPVDRSAEQIRNDVGLMKNAGFKVVRMGDLSWDYFESADGQFTFAAFDSVMNQMQAAGIKVILDIPGTPAPLWAHQKYPGMTLVREGGGAFQPAERYMEDITDPDYRRLVHRLAETMLKRYGRHPAVVAIGYNNEIGNGYLSYSEPTRQRFLAWLQKRYGDFGTLNKAWAGQRWSRQVSDWQQIHIPYESGPGPSERYLDLRRFWSDATIDLLRDMEALRRRHAPDKPALSNLYDASSRRGFDHLATQEEYISYPAFGFYKSAAVAGAYETAQTKGGLSTPIWFNEFQTGFFGDYGVKDRPRMFAHLGLLNGGQGFLAWTFNTHLGGEEQIYFGLLDHDDRPSWKLDEWARLASELKALEKLGFPRVLRPQIAISYSFESRVLADRKALASYYAPAYEAQRVSAFGPAYDDNIDVAVVNIGHADLSAYKLLVIPGEYLMDRKATDAVRRFVSQGGTAIMTALSAKADASGQWYATPLPGALNDVFGMRTNEFYKNSEALTGAIGDASFTTAHHYYEVLEPTTAQVLGRFTNLPGSPPAATLNKFGKGQAIYVATTAQSSVLQPIYRSLYPQLGIARGPQTPEGVYARVVNGRTLYVNTTAKSVEIEIEGQKKGRLSRTIWNGRLRLERYGVDLLE